MKTIVGAVVLPSLESQIASGDPLLVDPRGVRTPEGVPVFSGFGHAVPQDYLGRAANFRLDDEGNLVADLELISPVGGHGFELPPGVGWHIVGVAEHRTADVFDDWRLYSIGTSAARKALPGRHHDA